MSRFSVALLLLSGCLSCGCRTTVPMHVWQPPMLQSAVGKKVVVSAVTGPEEIADQVRQKLLAMAPRDAGRELQLIHSSSLQRESEIKLVSATDQEPSDLAVASVSRQQGVDFILRGQVLEDRYPGQGEESDKLLKLSWRLTPLKGLQRVEGKPVVVDLASAIDRYPDLGLLSDQQQILTSAAVRDTYRLIAPSVLRREVQLARNYAMPGSRDLRRGNAAAVAGRWAEAESIWQQVAERYPTQVAAVHNLALAAAAGQDFSRAKALARKAIRLQPTSLHQQTLVWIELRQRDYHESFGLPDPPEGWFVTN